MILVFLGQNCHVYLFKLLDQYLGILDHKIEHKSLKLFAVIFALPFGLFPMVDSYGGYLLSYTHEEWYIPY